MGRKENWLKQRMKRMIKAPPSEDYCGAGNDGDHAREIARATQVATEAAVKAANAAAVVLRLINIQPEWSREDLAAIKIQAAYRGHLAKHALRALKGVVKLQALFRGYLVRRQAKMVLHCMETLVRLQHRVRSRTLLNSVNSQLNGREFGET